MQSRVMRLPWGLIWTATVIAAIGAVVIGWAGDGTDSAAAEGGESERSVERECFPPPPPGSSRETFVIPAPSPRDGSGEGDVVRALKAPGGDGRMPVPEGCEDLLGRVRPLQASPTEMQRMEGHAPVIADCAPDRGVELPAPRGLGSGPAEGGESR